MVRARAAAGGRQVLGTVGGGTEGRGHAAAGAAPTAARLRLPSWRDSRLVVGLLLVAASVLTGVYAVESADVSVPVWAAVRTLPSGHRLASGDLRAVRLHVSGPVADYLRADRLPEPSGVLLRTVDADELVPTSAVGDPASLARRPVALDIASMLPDGVVAGAVVEIWSSPRSASGDGTYSTPVRLSAAAEVTAVHLPDASGVSTSGTTVQVLLTGAEVPPVLDALANQARIALVPTVASASS